MNQVKCIEDIYNDYIENINYHMFFKKNLTTLDLIINIIHVIGVIYIFIGMFLPPFHLPFYSVTSSLQHIHLYFEKHFSFVEVRLFQVLLLL